MAQLSRDRLRAKVREFKEHETMHNPEGGEIGGKTRAQRFAIYDAALAQLDVVEVGEERQVLEVGRLETVQTAAEQEMVSYRDGMKSEYRRSSEQVKTLPVLRADKDTGSSAPKPTAPPVTP